MSPEARKEGSAVRRSEREREVLRMTQQGFSAREIARVLECSSRTVVRIRARLGITEPGPVPIPSEVLAAAEAMLEDQCPFSEIARTLPISVSTLAKRFPGRGWSPEQTVENRSVMAQFNRQDRN